MLLHIGVIASLVKETTSSSSDGLKDVLVRTKLRATFLSRVPNFLSVGTSVILAPIKDLEI